MDSDHGNVQSPCTGSQNLFLTLHRMLDGVAWEDVRAEFRYDPASPLLVRITFLVKHGPRVTWYVGRDVLHEGLRSVSGTGDIQVWPTYIGEQTTVWMQLTSEEATVVFEMSARPLEEWLDHTYRSVPAGSEMARCDVDRFLAGILGGDPGLDSPHIR
ncbi:SsgA family sporulation/cell division regulator [Streptomyces tendae]|uniref:SsgA family sporulation/cell division regulator n=1 Tax=Streptomyces tendae TaxID=1932 RepID=UPI00342AA8D1